jgi:trigger factor
MAEKATPDPSVATDEQDFQSNVTVEDLGPATKKISIEIPENHIQDRIKEQFKEIRSQAAIPGFRPGHAPQKLIEKKFATDVKDQVRRTLVSESYEQALEKNNLSVLGEPEFENADQIQLPDAGPMTFSFTVEVQPEFTIPDLAGVKVKRPKIDVKDENVDQAMQNLREQQGSLMPVEDRGVQAKDYLLADVHVKADCNVLGHQHDAQIVARPGRIGGIQVDDLDKQLEGMKPGETRTIKAKAPDTHANEALRGKDVEI